MTERIIADLCIIGAGSGGLSVAAGAAQMGASVVLIEAHKMGGDCLNYGCVPSKALIAAGKAAQAHRSSAALGIAVHEPEVDYAAVMGHVQNTIATIAPHDSVERFEGLGVRVIQARASFTGPAEVTAGENVVAARRFVISTGSSPGFGALMRCTSTTPGTFAAADVSTDMTLQCAWGQPSARAISCFSGFMS